MAYSSAEINRISGSRLAVQNRKYIEENGIIWLGTKDNRLTRLYLKDVNVGVELNPTDPVTNLKTFLTDLQAQIDSITGTLENISTETVTNDFNVDPEINVYYVDCSSRDITATFDISTTYQNMLVFIRIDNSTNIFEIDATTSILFNNNSLPFNPILEQWDGLIVTSDSTNLFGIYSRDFDVSLLPTRDQKDAMDAANAPDASNPFLTLADFDEDSITVESITALRRQVVLNTLELDYLHRLTALLVFELIEQGVKIESEELINEIEIYIDNVNRR